MLRWIAGLIIRLAVWRGEYHRGHIRHAKDGSLYMGRYTLFETKWLSARVHNIATPDLDRHFHDHPWNFVSLVLRGGYVERRPAQISPCFIPGTGEEYGRDTFRGAGSISYRRACDRHRITEVEKDTWTLVIYGPKIQWWGFYAPEGKVYYRNYGTTHQVKAA